MARLTLRAPPPLMRFVAQKGSVALDGVSLTVNEVTRRHVLRADHPAHAEGDHARRGEGRRRHEPRDRPDGALCGAADGDQVTALVRARLRLLLTRPNREGPWPRRKEKPANRRSLRARASSSSRRGSTSDIADALLAGAPRRSTRPGASWDSITVPGSLEIVPAIAIAVDAAEQQKKPYDGVVALGCVIQGETFHFDIVAMQSARALIDFSVAHRLPCRQRHPHRRQRGAGLGARAAHRGRQGRRRRARGAGADRAQAPARQAVAAWPRRPHRARTPRQPPRRGAARRGAGALPDGSRGDAAERDPGRVREPLDRPRGRGRAISAGRGRVLPRHGRRRGCRAAQARPADRRGAGEGWPLKRIETVLRAILRAGAYELDSAATCRRAWWCRNMSTSPTPSSNATRPAWSTPCSTRLRGSCAPPSSSDAEVSAVARTPNARIGRGPADRASFQADCAASRRVGADRRRRGARAAAGPRLVSPPMPSSAACIFSRRSGRRGRAQGAAGQSVRSRRQGRKPAGFLLTLALPKGVGERLAQAFCARARRRREALRLSVARRRHGAHARTADGLDHGVRRAAGGHHGAARWRAGRRPRRGHRHHRRRRARACSCGKDRDRCAAMDIVGARAGSSDAALSGAGAAQRAGLRGPQIRHSRDGCVGRTCRRSRQALPRLGRGGESSMSRACRCRPRRKRRRMAERQMLETALSGGDDYEIVCTVRPARACIVPGRGPRAGVPVTDIGRIVRGAGASFRRPDGKAMTSPAPHSAIFDSHGRAILETVKSRGSAMHDIASRVAAISGHKEARIF